MDSYKKAVQEYIITMNLDKVRPIHDPFINRLLERIEETYQKLTPEEQEMVRMPRFIRYGYTANRSFRHKSKSILLKIWSNL